MKNINWKVRFKKKSFWVAIISAIALFINNITQALGLDYTAQVEQFSNGVNGVLAVLVTFGVINDPTTKGLKDSGIAQTYAKPRDEQENPVEYQSNDKDLKAQIGIMQPQEYDTSEPFTDDSDEVYFDVAEYEDDEELPRGASKFHDDEVLKVGDKDDSKTN
ncbi:phage holin [Staphylococcus saprophyticus]|nr:phage holin [Staphylococcus saprophyticus]